MFLKNYTSESPVSLTAGRIEQTLIKCGVSGITKEYGPNQEVSALRFHIPTPSGEASIRLPVEVERAIDVLWLNYADGDQISKDGKQLAYPFGNKKKKREDFRQQGERTAWKLTQDWLEVQMSMIQMKQADTLQVFLPYVWDGRETIYQKIMSGQFRALLPEKTRDA